MLLITFGELILIVFRVIGYMKHSSTGLWERQVSKVPSNLLSSEKEADYTKCVYIGFTKRKNLK